MSIKKLYVKPVGIINTPFKDVTEDVPIQGRMMPDAEGYLTIYKKYHEACRDLDGFSHVILIYYFHRSKTAKLTAKPYMDTKIRGIFASRFPHRPNHIGLTLVEILNVSNGILKIRGVDMIDGTPLLDIKPYNPAFDSVESSVQVKIGWMGRYMSGEQKPVISKTGSREDWLNEDE
jgi:tRNA-Thr(GGU) m(6)t(6)A37 methyltransferase TsaA